MGKYNQTGLRRTNQLAVDCVAEEKSPSSYKLHFVLSTLILRVTERFIIATSITYLGTKHPPTTCLERRDYNIIHTKMRRAFTLNNGYLPV